MATADHALTYAEIVQRRRNLNIPGYQTLAEVGFDGDWVTPYQRASKSPTGPVLVAYNWLDAPSAAAHQGVLEASGFLPDMTFNRVLDRALALRGLTREDIYVTQVFHLLPSTRSAPINAQDAALSFEQVTLHEVAGRRVIAMGAAAARACAAHGVPCAEVRHPSARGLTHEAKAQQIAEAMEKLGY